MTDTPKKRSAPRLSHAEIIQAQKAYYEPLMQELAAEINQLREQLEADRATLAKVRASWVYAVQYWAKGEI